MLNFCYIETPSLISDFERCDKKVDCKDGSDEVACPTEAKECDPQTEFQCDSKTCILMSDVCDGHEDCLDGKDEDDCDLPNPCINNNGGCPTEAKCVSIKQGNHYCECRQGYNFVENQCIGTIFALCY